MACWVKQHSDILLRLILRQGGPDGDGFGDRGSKVADLEVEVHHCPLGPRFQGPDWRLVAGSLLEHEVHRPIRCRRNGRF
jgi:hypothetical protein